MSPEIFFAVAFSALFQASWNFVTKSSKADKIALLSVGWFALGILLLPVALYFDPISTWTARAGWFMLASGLVHGVYLCTLGWAYKLGEISVVYPIARGLGVAGTTLITVGLQVHLVSLQGGLGILAVVLGTMVMAMREVPDLNARKAFSMAVLVGLIVSAYSVIDSFGSRETSVLVYLALMNLTAPIFAAPYLFWRLKPEMMAVCKKHKFEASFVAMAGSVSYGIVLWAYQRSPAAYVATTREVSVVFATLLGIFILKERADWRKSAGIVMIVLGLVLIKLA